MSTPVAQDTIRAFVAIELPTAVIAALVAVQRQLAAANLPLRLPAAAGLHLTLAFIGAIPSARVPDLIAATQRGAAGVAPFAVRAEGLGMFPNARAPRVVWAGVQGAPEAMAALTTLRGRLAAELAAAGFPVDGRFDPHLTLARVADRATPADRAQVGATVQALPPLAASPCPVGGVTVMRSDLRPSGAVYSRLAVVVLTG